LKQLKKNLGLVLLIVRINTNGLAYIRQLILTQITKSTRLLKNKNLKVTKVEKKKHSVLTLYDDTKKLADAENKVPVIALCQKRRKGFWIIIKSTDLDTVINVRNNNK
jgi:hypothetical protein